MELTRVVEQLFDGCLLSVEHQSRHIVVRPVWTLELLNFGQTWVEIRRVGHLRISEESITISSRADIVDYM